MPFFFFFFLLMNRLRDHHLKQHTDSNIFCCRVVSDLSDRSHPSTPLSSPSGSTDAPTASGQRMVEIREGVYVQQAILDLEQLLDTSKCLDLFTMAPKVMSPSMPLIASPPASRSTFPCFVL